VLNLKLKYKRPPYVSSPKNITSNTTASPYKLPIPYDHRQVVLATRKPKTNGEMKGEMMKPMVHRFS
jgi:hypothetical protein